MTFEELGNELRQHRLAKNISLSAISAATRINSKFLHALEEGNFSILPQTYIRAFLREYAVAVGADSNDILSKYNEALQHQELKTASIHSTTSLHSYSNEPHLQWLKFFREYRYFLATGIAILILVLWYIYTSTKTSYNTRVEEIPFDRVIKETEVVTGTKPELIIKEAPPRIPSTTIDSLTMTITTVDSVWMSIIIDETTVREYIFPPNTKRTLKAASKFTITAGNAGAVYLRINNKDLGVLGKPGTVIRNKEFTRKILLSQ